MRKKDGVRRQVQQGQRRGREKGEEAFMVMRIVEGSPFVRKLGVCLVQIVV